MEFIDFENDVYELDKMQKELAKMNTEIQQLSNEIDSDLDMLDKANAEYEKIKVLEQKLTESPENANEIKTEIAKRSKKVEELLEKINTLNQ